MSPLDLSFSVLPEKVVPEDPQKPPFLRVHVRALLKGRLFSELDLDAAELLAQGTTATEHMGLFYCGCGSPDCMGMMPPVALTEDESHITWHFPLEPYSRAFRPFAWTSVDGRPFVRNRNGGTPDYDTPAQELELEIRFERAQYIKALDELTAELLELEKSFGMPVALAPYPVEDAPRVPLALSLLQARDAVLHWDELHKMHETLFGELRNEEVRVPLLHGVTLSIAVVLVAQLTAEQMLLSRLPGRELESLGAELTHLLKTEVVPAFMSDREAVLNAAKALPWAVAEPACYPVEEPVSHSATEDWRSLPQPVLELAWSQAKMEIIAST